MSAPGSNDFANATPIGVSDPSITPTAGLTADPVPPDLLSGEMTAWWKWTADYSRIVTISTAGSTPIGLDTRLWVYRADVEDPTVEQLQSWWYVDDEGTDGAAYSAEIHTMQAFAGETYWIRCALYDAEDAEYHLEITPADIDLAPAKMPPDTTPANPRTNPVDGELYLAHLSQNQWYDFSTLGVWVGRRDGDGVTELGRMLWPDISNYDQVTDLRWLDANHFMCVVTVAESPTHEQRIMVGTVIDDVVTFGPLQPYGNYVLSYAPRVEGTTVKFFVQEGYYPVTGLGVLSFDFGTGTATNITVTPFAFPWPDEIEPMHSQFLDGGNYLIHTQDYVYLLRADGSTGPQCPIGDLQEDPSRPDFDTMAICSGWNTWVNIGREPAVLGYGYGDHDFWAPGVAYSDTDSEACWVHYDLNTGVREVFRMGVISGTWGDNDGAVYPGQSGKLSNSVFLVTYAAPKNMSDAYVQHNHWLVVDAATRTMVALEVTGDKVDLGRMSGIPSGTPDGLSGMVTGWLYGYALARDGAFFYPANPAPEGSGTLEVVRRVFV